MNLTKIFSCNLHPTILQKSLCPFPANATPLSQGQTNPLELFDFGDFDLINTADV